MNILVSIICYESAHLIEKCIKPWRVVPNHHTRICAAHGVFPEVAVLGGTIYSKDGTDKVLEELVESESIYGYKFMSEPTYERDIRNETLKLYGQFDGAKPDLVWLVDADEWYEQHQILEILELVEKHRFMEFFKIKFINKIKYKGREASYQGFLAPRIYRNDKNNGIKCWYYDNEIEWNSGMRTEKAPCLAISNPKINHLSWTGTDEYLKRKVDFAKLHYGQCSFRWGNEGLEFDKEYYIRNNKELPILEYID